jgi:hypothetical protein
VEILEAFNLTRCAHSAAELVGWMKKTVTRYVWIDLALPQHGMNDELPHIPSPFPFPVVSERVRARGGADVADVSRKCVRGGTRTQKRGAFAQFGVHAHINAVSRPAQSSHQLSTSIGHRCLQAGVICGASQGVAARGTWPRTATGRNGQLLSGPRRRSWSRRQWMPADRGLRKLDPGVASVDEGNELHAS